MVSGIQAVFLTHGEALLRFLRARGGGEEAEDLLQELWLKVTVAPSAPVADPLAYLYRMANNLMLDRRRAEHRRRRRERDWSDAAGAGTELASSAEAGDRVLLGREQIRVVEAALATLGERTETIFRRFRIDGMSQQQIAHDDGISLSAVEKHLQKAYRALLVVKDLYDAD